MKKTWKLTFLTGNKKERKLTFLRMLNPEYWMTSVSSSSEYSSTHNRYPEWSKCIFLSASWFIDLLNFLCFMQENIFISFVPFLILFVMSLYWGFKNVIEIQQLCIPKIALESPIVCLKLVALVELLASLPSFVCGRSRTCP